MTHERTRVGFVGLGVMGSQMAGHLAAAGDLVAVHDIDPAVTTNFAAAHPGVRATASATELAGLSDVVLTMLPDGHVVREVVFGPDGLVHGLERGALLVDTSSSQPWLTATTAASLSERAIAFVDAPVSGAQWGAEAAELVFMVGGAPEDVERARPLLEVLGRAVFHLGPTGSGHIMKSINNTVSAVTLQATLEGLALGVTAGLDPQIMNDVFNESTAGSWVTRTHIEQRILSGSYDDPFRLALMRKDIDITTELAEQFGVELPLVARCASSYRAADDEAGPGRSLSEIGRWIERRVGVAIADRTQ